jgi:hypothetical protein
MTLSLSINDRAVAVDADPSTPQFPGRPVHVECGE